MHVVWKCIDKLLTLQIGLKNSNVTRMKNDFVWMTELEMENKYIGIVNLLKMAGKYISQVVGRE